jgi:hypothetical protein
MSAELNNYAENALDDVVTGAYQTEPLERRSSLGTTAVHISETFHRSRHRQGGDDIGSPGLAFPPVSEELEGHAAYMQSGGAAPGFEYGPEL